MKSFILPNGEICYYIDKPSALESFNEIFNNNIYENHGLVVKDGDIVFDVGANIGLFTRFITEKAKNLKIYTFEPVPAIFKVQKKNLESIQGRHEIQLFNIGLGNKADTIIIHYYPRATTFSAIIPIDLDSKLKKTVKNWEQIKQITPFARFIPKFLRKPIAKIAFRYIFKEQKVLVQVRTLSDIISETNVNTIDFMKIDAENYEWQIFRGITKSDWKKIKQIAMEVHMDVMCSENLLEEITKLLESKGFSVYLDKDGKFSVTGVYMLYAKK